MRTRLTIAVVVALALAPAPAPAATASEPVGTRFPAGFPEIRDSSLGTPLLGYGAAGPRTRTPVVIVHGNNDTPFPTACNAQYGFTHNLAQYLHDQGHALSELWGVGYQGEQCDLAADNTRRAGEAHTVAANVPDIRAFMNALFAFTQARQVDIVAHSIGSPLMLEWMRQDNAYVRVRRFVSIDGTNHGIVNCSPSPLNYYALAAFGGFAPDSAICREVGSIRTPLYSQLLAGDETPGPTEYLAIYNEDKSFVYISALDGMFPPVPEQDRDGRPHSFARSAMLAGARNVPLRGQDRYGGAPLASSHVSIANSPETFALTRDFLAEPGPPPPRVRASRLTLTVRASGRRLRASGRLRVPAGTPCRGRVRIRVISRGRTLARRNAPLSAACTYASSLPLGRRTGATVSARFTGSDAIEPLASRRVRLR